MTDVMSETRKTKRGMANKKNGMRIDRMTGSDSVKTAQDSATSVAKNAQST